MDTQTFLIGSKFLILIVSGLDFMFQNDAQIQRF